MVSREDVLRELELLPVWQLRAPLDNKVEQTATEKLPAEKTIELAPTLTQKSEAEFDCYVSENNTWIFICAQDGMPGSPIDIASQSMLFDNILVAMQIKAKKTAINLAEIDAKIMIAMGETVAQNLLKSAESIEQLRGKQHLLHNLPLIVTYSTAEILEHLPNKAKTWHDLCTALRLVNA
jgi:uracil-DNA glycosylase